MEELGQFESVPSVKDCLSAVRIDCHGYVYAEHTHVYIFYLQLHDVISLL